MKIFIILLLGLSAALAVENQQIEDISFANIVQEAALRTNVNLIKADANEWCDLFLANVRQLCLETGLDRVILPEIYQAFEKTILFVTWKGEFWLHDGWLSGLETVRRTGPAELFYENGEIIIKFEGGCTKPTLAYDGLAKFMGLGPDMTVRGSLSQVTVRFAIRFTLAPEIKIVLEELVVPTTGALDIEIKGLGIILNHISEFIVNGVGNLLKGFVVSIFTGPIRDIVNTVLDHFLTMPIPSFVQNIEQLRGNLIQMPETQSNVPKMQIKLPQVA